MIQNKKEFLFIGLSLIFLALAFLYLLFFTTSCDYRDGNLYWADGVPLDTIQVIRDLNRLDTMMICIDWAKKGVILVAIDTMTVEVEPGIFAVQNVNLLFSANIDTVDHSYVDSIRSEVEWQ